MVDIDKPNNNLKLLGLTENQFCVVMHLSQLLGFVPPLLMWAVFKDKSDFVDGSGTNVLNWMICSMIYGFVIFVVGIVLMWAFPLFVERMFYAVGVLYALFAIRGAIKAHKGEVYAYPFAIRFIK